jgi:hypothetical protein
MTEISHSTPTTRSPGDIAAPASPRLWRVAGGLALAHVVLLFAGASQEAFLERGADAGRVQEVYGSAHLTRVFTGGYVEAMSFLVLMAAVVLVAGVWSRGHEAGRRAAQTFLALGVACVAATLAVGFPAGAAAAWWSQHGAQPSAVAMVNDIRNYSYVLQIALQAAMALALGIAALAHSLFAKWVGWGGVAVGVVGLVAVPFLHDAVGMAWLIWWVGLGVLLLRGPRAARSGA